MIQRSAAATRAPRTSKRPGRSSARSGPSREAPHERSHAERAEPHGPAVRRRADDPHRRASRSRRPASLPDADTVMAPSAGALRPGKPPPTRRRFPLAEVAGRRRRARGDPARRLAELPRPRARTRGSRPRRPLPLSAAAPAGVRPDRRGRRGRPEPSPEPSPEPTAEPTAARRASHRPADASREPVRIAAVPTARPRRLPRRAVVPTPRPAGAGSARAVLRRWPSRQAPTFALPSARPAAASPRPAPTEQDRIRETVQALREGAEHSRRRPLRARLPGVDRARIAQAFESFRSQSVEFEIRASRSSPARPRPSSGLREARRGARGRKRAADRRRPGPSAPEARRRLGHHRRSE